MKLFGYVADTLARAISQGSANLCLAIRALKVDSLPRVDVVDWEQPSETSLAGWWFADLRTGLAGKIGADLGGELLVRWDTINGNRKTLDQALTAEHVAVSKELATAWTFYATYPQRDRALERLQIPKHETGAEVTT